MNNILIKTLNILVKNVEKYNVKISKYFGENYEIDYSINSEFYIISISQEHFYFEYHLSKIGSIGKEIMSKFKDDVTKAEVMLLVEKLKSACEDYTSTKFRSFVENENIMNNNGIDD